MAFDQTTRNRLQRFVSETRALLTEEFTRQLQHEYGMNPEAGEVAALEKLGHLDDARLETARLLRETFDHYLAASPSGVRKEVLDRIVREQAFTILNRLCALRMAEARGLLVESIARGYQSKGFQLYARLAGTALGETGDAYRCYLFSILDEFALDLPVLFDRFSPQGRLFPREAALLQVLDRINHPDIDPLWAEDETIGWIYQYFNSVEERKKMRAESSAPRNSRELAVRNQFFTPRYVVAFLTDNTLGRIWHEMTRGHTTLKDACQYLVRRPTEVFLAEGEQAPQHDAAPQDLSREDLLKQPVYIPFRPLKDPRDIRMLDPACGSMHFGLYAFDLFERIYEEAWDIAHANDETRESSAAFAPFAAFANSFPGKAAFLADVPRLIIEHNIHGIEIDPRAVQISGLSLWLRAQRSWQAQGLKPQDRPRIQRSNIVCAEPMPGEEHMRREFVESLRPRVIGQLVEVVFDKMKLAGEAGSLLKIEEDILAAVTDARSQWKEGGAREQTEMFPDLVPRKPRQEEMRFDVGEVSDDDFWNHAEGRVLAALKEYAERIGNGHVLGRRLFADDAARGFAFIDLCRKRFDVTVMNPPFGEWAAATKAWASRSYPRTKNDIYAAFIERGLNLLVARGLLGAITSRTGFFLTSFRQWREEILLKEARPTVVADLGYGVMDDAMVEAAAYCLEAMTWE